MLKLISIAALAIVVLCALWFLVIAPAEKRDHQRRMELVQQKLERHEARKMHSETMENDDNRDNDL
jgi:hypothetical protein